MVAKREKDRADMVFDLRPSYSKNKSTSQQIIRNMSNNKHKKYYEYILSKLRFQREQDQEKQRELEQSQKIKLPRLVQTEDEDQELFKSLSTYIKNDEFMEQNKKMIHERNKSFDRDHRAMSKSQTGGNQSLELSQFLKVFEKKKNLVYLGGGDDGYNDVVKGNDNISTRKNKQIMDKMYELMTKKSKNRMRWESLDKMRQEKFDQQRHIEQEEIERKQAHELMEQQYINMLSSRAGTEDSFKSDSDMDRGEQDTETKKKIIKNKLSNLRDFVQKEIQKEQPFNPVQVMSNSKMELEKTDDNSNMQRQLTLLYKKSEEKMKESKSQNKKRIKLIRQESMQLPTINQNSRNQISPPSKNASSFIKHQYQSSTILQNDKKNSFITLMPTQQGNPTIESNQSNLGLSDFNSNQLFQSQILSPYRLNNNLINGSILLQNINDQSQFSSMKGRLKHQHLQLVDNVLDNCQTFLSGDIKYTKSSVAKLNRFIQYQSKLVVNEAQKKKNQDIKNVIKAISNNNHLYLRKVTDKNQNTLGISSRITVSRSPPKSFVLKSTFARNASAANIINVKQTMALQSDHDLKLTREISIHNLSPINQSITNETKVPQL
ncbi:UNKNOWN [Stylonychia lemnae]|uniref:Uncharacterized protein n=1 Tax=Stylonychia lemnae TaxID=5949 RepID=A0A078AMB4_STYLE|nr:UNKNOWN [Stylonychia lemnae]|eukprot:CDW83041.1 UNKNOWN [Stylonychia lemnae]